MKMCFPIAILCGLVWSLHSLGADGQSSAPIQVTPTGGWKAISASDGAGVSDAYGIDYQGSGWPALLLSAPMKPGVSYRITWQMKGSPEEGQIPFVMMKTQGDLVYIDAYSLSSQWTGCTFYLHANAQESLKARLYLNPGPASQIQIKNLRIQPLAESDLYQELLPDGDWESASQPLASWIKAYSAKTNPASVVGTSDFISGSRSLKLEFAAQEKGDSGICSIHLPVVPGKTGEFRFWAKSEHETAVTVWVDTWPTAHQGKHYYKAERIKLTGDWKEYVVRLAIPSTFDEYPDAKAKMVLIRINGQPGTAYFDAMSFKNIP